MSRSSSSAGANYRETQSPKPGKNFLKKPAIVEEETNDTVYLFKLLAAINEDHFQLIEPLRKEGTKILRIIVASIELTRQKMMK